MRLPMEWMWKVILPLPLHCWKPHNNKPKHTRNVRDSLPFLLNNMNTMIILIVFLRITRMPGASSETKTGASHWQSPAEKLGFYWQDKRDQHPNVESRVMSR